MEFTYQDYLECIKNYKEDYKEDLEIVKASDYLYNSDIEEQKLKAYDDFKNLLKEIEKKGEVP